MARVLRAPAGAHRRLAALGDQGLVAREELLHLHRIIGERFRRGVDRGEAAADHHHRQAHGEIGEAVGLGRAGELQRHQEVRGLAHAAREAVLHRHDGRPPGAGAERDVVEAQREGARRWSSVPPKRTPPNMANSRAPLQQQADELEEILVPAHGDAVFGDAAETGHDAVVERFVKLAHVAHRLEGMARRRASRRRKYPRAAARSSARRWPTTCVAVIHQMMREREARRAQPDHQHLVAGCRPAAAAGAD